MKLKFFIPVACGVLAVMTSCGGSSKSTDAVEADTIIEGATEVILDSVSPDSATVVAEAASDVVKVFDNESKAEATDKPLVIDFSATWCGPCQQFKPTFHKVAEEYASKADFATADVDICTNLAKKYQIQSIPYILIINTDGTTAYAEGKMSEGEFKAFLDKNMK